MDLGKIRDSLIYGVRRRLMCDLSFGSLLSGGLDSSLIASITKRLFEEDCAIKRIEPKELHSFCIGIEGSPDLVAQREVADFLKNKHYEFVFTVNDGIDAIHDNIYHCNSINPTPFRASIPNYLLARKIKSLGIKMVLTGEGSDEIFGGYSQIRKNFIKKTLEDSMIFTNMIY